MFVYLNKKEPIDVAFKFKPIKGSFTEEFLEVYKYNLLDFEGSDISRNFLGFKIESLYLDNRDLERLVVSSYRSVPSLNEEDTSSHNLELLIVYDKKSKVFSLSEPEYFFSTTDESLDKDGTSIEDEVLEERYLKFKEEWDKLNSEEIYNTLKEILFPLKDKDLAYKELNYLREVVVDRVEEKIRDYINRTNPGYRVVSYFQKALKKGLHIFSAEYFPQGRYTPCESVVLDITGLPETDDLKCNSKKYEISKEVARELVSELTYIQKVNVCL